MPGKKVKDNKGRTPGKSSQVYRKKYGAPDPRTKVKGGGGGVKRKKSPTLKPASKKVIKTARKLNKAKGRKYKK
jgi:hypothetical protein